MKEKQLTVCAKKHRPSTPYFRHACMAFISGGMIGVFGQAILLVYEQIFFMKEKDALAMMSVSIMAIAAILTALGKYDCLAQKCGAGMFIPISGFANSLVSSAMEGKSEGLVNGIGSNMFKLAGTVITYGIVAAVVFGSLRYLLMVGFS